MKNYLLLCLLLLSGSVFAQIELPIDFESTTIDYDLTDFAGNASMIVVDPTVPTTPAGLLHIHDCLRVGLG